MKKKFREITVDGNQYAWRVYEYGDGDSLAIKIWLDKKVIYDEITNLAEVTPQTIADIIMVDINGYQTESME